MVKACFVFIFLYEHS